MGGFAGRILQVDLTHGRITTIPLDVGLAEKYLGGLGLAIKLAFDLLAPNTPPLSPENVAVLGVGPLVGTSLPSTSRVFAVTRLPAGGSVGWCGAGGVNFGCQFKNAGYDHLILTGRAEKPVYLAILDDRVEIRDAAGLWGRGIDETCHRLWKTHGQPAGVLAIGQSGENLSSLAMAFIDRMATLGRGGFGAVLGSKNLKAVLVKGTLGVKVAKPKEYRRLNRELTDRIRTYPFLKEWQDLGMIKSFPLIDPELYRRLKKRRAACVSCPLGCKDVIRIPDGPDQGRIVYSSSVVNLFTPVIYGLTDYRQAIKLIAALDDYGLDMFEFFGVMGFAAQLVKDGVIPKSEASPDIAIDSYESMSAWAAKVALGQGLGRVLAKGFAGIFEAFGPELRPSGPALVKNMHPYAGPGAALPWDLFGTMELGQILDPRGPHVGSGGSPTYFARRPLEVFPKHLARMGVPPEAVRRILADGPDGQPSLQVGALLKYSHNWFTLLGSLGICARAQVNRFYNAELCLDLYRAVTGLETGPEELRRSLDRIWTLLRLANLKQGWTRAWEEPPEQWFRESGFKDYLSGTPLTKADAETMIEDYYREWGWAAETGIPTPARLDDLGLSEIFPS
jgi:aldehyde:ferredoxin oxidoreductase